VSKLKLLEAVTMQQRLNKASNQKPETRLEQAKVEEDTSTDQPFVFVDPVSAKVFNLACKVGLTNMPVLITGPTGAGKEIMARVVHESSVRADKPFIAINCSAITPSLAEDLLFGHERGAFTGANGPHAGCFEQAEGGTLFLDEIGEMPLELQPKLLRVLQEKKLTRIGGKREIAIDVRIVAATNANMHEDIQQGLFREDLYYRLSAFNLQLPALSDRPLDIKALALLMLQKHAVAQEVPEISKEALHVLLSHHWPGNVRELENVMARALLLCDGAIITPNELMFDQPSEHVTPAHGSVTSQVVGTLQESAREVECKQIIEAMRVSHCRGDAATRLGISERTLRYKLQRMRQAGMEVPKVYSR